MTWPCPRGICVERWSETGRGLWTRSSLRPLSLQLLNMSLELSELRTSLQAAETAIASDLERMPAGAQGAATAVPSFPSSEAAVQAILECLRSHEPPRAVRYIQECR